jgi:transcriptional regulator with XRE-family HTH domain
LKSATHEQLLTNLRHLLEAKQMSMNELSRRSGLGQTNVHDILSGKTQSPTLATLERIAATLDTTLVDLLQEPRPSVSKPDLFEAIAQLNDEDRNRLLLAAQAWIKRRS